ncbi:hypothetical protein R1flu_026620 [Riccia fluitans]|uniref:Uncharacterized protein n=1 Tax=Riccia fluitans TaxID=41844 RepID=A0ABD1XGG6_9MARC
MDSNLRLRISVAVLICFSLVSSLLTGGTSGNSVKVGFPHAAEVQDATVLKQLSSSNDEALCEFRIQGFQKAPQFGISSAAAARDNSAPADSAGHESPRDLIHPGEESAYIMFPRRVLRDISPPGMWPPGPPDESLPWINRRRALLTAVSKAGAAAAAGGGEGRDGSRKSKIQLDVTLSFLVQSLLRYFSAASIWRQSDSPITEGFFNLVSGKNEVPLKQVYPCWSWM